VSFNPGKGFGFARPDDSTADGYFKAEHLIDMTPDTCYPGLRVQFQLSYTGGKPQARNVYPEEDAPRGTKRSAPGAAEEPPWAKRTNVGAAAAVPGASDLEGTVASFNPNKGFGFISSAQDKDAYFKTEHLAGMPAEFCTAGARVYFDLQHFDGKPQARNIRPMEV